MEIAQPIAGVVRVARDPAGFALAVDNLDATRTESRELGADGEPSRPAADDQHVDLPRHAFSRSSERTSAAQ